MKFSHMSLSRRLLVCFSLLAIIPVLLGGVSIWQNQSMQSRVNHLNDTALPQVIEANHIIDNSNLVTNPLQALEYSRLGTAIAGEIGKLALMPDDSPTRFKGKPGPAALHPLPGRRSV